MPGGFEEGERYRGQQTTLEAHIPLEERILGAMDDLCSPIIQDLKSHHLIPVRKPALPVQVILTKGEYVNEHLYFRCQGYRPYGGDPNYRDKFGYHTYSDDCARCHLVIDGVKYKPDFHCRRDNHGSQHHIYHDLFNQNPLDHVDPQERKTITAGLKWLWQDEGGKHVKRTKKPKNLPED